MRLSNRYTKFVAPALIGAMALLPTGAFAQQVPVTNPPHEQAFCGIQMPVLGSDTLAISQPADMGENDKGVLNLSAVRGQLVHMEGPLMLLRIEEHGVGNATTNKELAGDGWAVIQLPSDCSPEDFAMGTPILAIGRPTDQGILDALEVTESA